MRGQNKFAEVVNVRPVDGEDWCYGEVRVVNPLGRLMRQTRIVFTDEWFRDWRHGIDGN